MFGPLFGAHKLERRTFPAPSAEFQTKIAQLFCAQDSRQIEAAVAEHFDGARVSVVFDPDAVQFAMSCAWWRNESGVSRFAFRVFEPGLLVNTVVERWLALFELFLAFEQSRSSFGRLVVNFNDAGLEPGLAFSGNSADHILIPDHIFLAKRGYAKDRKHFERHALPWRERSVRVFWRGTLAGKKKHALFDVPRVRLCQIAQMSPNEWFNVGLVESAEMSESDKQQLAKADLLKDRVPWKQLGRFRFHIDIDGHANTYAALFRKLLSGGLVLKVAPPDGCRQWYYDRMKPWRDFVPIKPDLSDLLEVIAYCREQDNRSRRIAESGRRLARSLTYDREFVRAVRAIEKASAK